LYPSPNTIRVIESKRMRWIGHVARMGDIRNVYNTLIRKVEEKRQLRKLRRRWEDNIRIDLRGTGREVVEWIHVVQDGY